MFPQPVHLSFQSQSQYLMQLIRSCCLTWVIFKCPPCGSYVHSLLSAFTPLPVIFSKCKSYHVIPLLKHILREGCSRTPLFPGSSLPLLVSPFNYTSFPITWIISCSLDCIFTFSSCHIEWLMNNFFLIKFYKMPEDFFQLLFVISQSSCWNQDLVPAISGSLSAGSWCGLSVGFAVARLTPATHLYTIRRLCWLPPHRTRVSRMSRTFPQCLHFIRYGL